MNEAFEATLSPNQRHLAHRLESFGDVVFGFTISQLAFQLVVPHAPTDLTANPINYFIYFATFALVALLWLQYHRMLSTFFRPEPADLVFTFVYLSFIGLVPYAMNANVRFAGTLIGGEYGFGLYILCAAVLQAMGVALSARNFARGRAYYEPAERRVALRRVLISACLVPLFVVQLIVDITVNVGIASCLFLLIPVIVLVVRWRLAKVAPPAAAVTATPG